MNTIKTFFVKVYSTINAMLHVVWWKLEYIWPHRYVWIKKMGIKNVIDVGASRGQSIQKWRSLLWNDIVFHCFEPLQKPFSILKRKYHNDKKIHLHNYALGDEHTTSSMHVSNIDDSSSLLKPSDHMIDTYTQIHFDEQQDIVVQRLDDVRSSLGVEWPTLMKVDTQWFEEKVFLGAKETLKQITIIVVELSFQEFYDWQPLFNEVSTQLFEYGFRYYGSFEQSWNPQDGMPLQQDAIFISHVPRS